MTIAQLDINIHVDAHNSALGFDEKLAGDVRRRAGGSGSTRARRGRGMGSMAVTMAVVVAVAVTVSMGRYGKRGEGKREEAEDGTHISCQANDSEASKSVEGRGSDNIAHRYGTRRRARGRLSRNWVVRGKGGTTSIIRS